MHDFDLCAVLSELLRVDAGRITEDASLFQLGLDSITALALQGEIEQRLDVEIELEEIFGVTTVGDLARAIASARGGERSTSPLRVDPARCCDPFPLTDMQQAYWVGRQGIYALGRTSLHGYVEIESHHLDPVRLQHAWNALIVRHPMLRATIDADGLQRVLAHVPEYLPVTHDLRSLDEQALEAALHGIRERMSHQVHDLGTWPAFEIAISLLPGGLRRAHFSIDGIFLDFRSFQILFHDLSRLYDGQCLEPAPQTGFSFRDYVLYVREHEQGAEAMRDLEWWRGRLELLSEPPRLPLRTQPESLRDQQMLRREMRLSAAAWRAIETRLEALSVTPAAFMLTVYADVLALWSESPSFAVNVPIFNRPRIDPAIDATIGNFSSFVLVDFDYSQPQSFTERLVRTRANLHAALQHSHVSGVAILRELYRRRGTHGGAAMPVVFTSLPSQGQSAISQAFEEIDTRLGEVVHAITQTPQVWLDNQIWYVADGVRINWDHVAGLFPEGMIDEMFQAYEQVLLALANDANAWDRSHHLALTEPFHHQQVALHGPPLAYPQHSLYTLFEQAAERHADRPAILDGTRCVTYAQLRGMSCTLGARLKAAGARDNALVAIVADKGWEQIVSVMAVLHAGCAYLPVDPSLPRARIDYLLENGRVQVVLVQPRHAALAGPGRAVLEITPDLQQSSPDSTAAPVPASTDDLAYVIYTSGSTGQPKGVMVTHANVVSMVAHTNTALGIGPEDRALALTALHHDLSVYDLFGMLSAGGAVVLPDAASLKEPAHWLQVMRRHGVTLWNSVPALMDMLVTELESQGLDGTGVPLRTVILGGDWVPVPLPGRIAARFPRAYLLSIGGPTETTVWNIWYPMGQVDPSWSSIPYGKAISNNSYYLLNYAGQHCPRWVKGEMHCAGAGVARGYFQDPHQTQARFFPHPLTCERIYRTGDLGRYLPDGNLEFMGRADFQLKVRGMRIEAGEIERAIESCAGVRSAVVVAAGEGVDKLLVAHVVAEESKDKGQGAAGAFFEQDEADPELILDGPTRLAFKLEERGLRRDLSGATIALEGFDPDGKDTRRLWSARSSWRSFKTAPIDPVVFGRWLSSLAQIRGGEHLVPKYRYPSAGGLYPVQTYLYLKPGAVTDFDPGYYYYDPHGHRLQRLGDDAHLPSAYRGYLAPLSQGAAFSVFFVAALSAIVPMYGRLARDFCLLEAGYLAQLLMAQAAEVGIGLCPVGMLADRDLRTSLRLREDDLIIHSMVGGLPAEAEATRTAQAQALRLDSLIRDTLTSTLPAHMVPARIVMHDALPLTANGKIDRQALMRTEVGIAAPEAGPPAAAETGTERLLSELVLAEIGGHEVDVKRSLFELGLNSVSLIRLRNGLNQRVGRSLSVTDIFAHPSIRELATLLDAQSSPSQPTTTPEDDIERRAQRKRKAMARPERKS